MKDKWVEEAMEGTWQHGKAYHQVPAFICDTFARSILCAPAIWGGYFALYEQINPPKYLRNKSEIPHLNFTLPPHNLGLGLQVRKPPLPNPSFPYDVAVCRSVLQCVAVYCSVLQSVSESADLFPPTIVFLEVYRPMLK